MSLQDTINQGIVIAQKVEEIATAIETVFPPAASIASAIVLGTKIAIGVVNEVPAIVATYDDIKAAIAGGQPITDDQWAAWQTAVDQAHTDFVAAATDVANQAP